jgi:hypothetical protein
MRALLMLSVLALMSNPTSAQSSSTDIISACDDQVSWCDLGGHTVPAGPAQIRQQCELFPRSCNEGQPLELADSGCVEDNWRNFCTDNGKLRDPTPAEIESLDFGISGANP